MKLLIEAIENDMTILLDYGLEKDIQKAANDLDVTFDMTYNFDLELEKAKQVLEKATEDIEAFEDYGSNTSGTETQRGINIRLFTLFMTSEVRATFEKKRLKILPVLTRKHYTSFLHWV
jgi:hypothetical protein